MQYTITINQKAILDSGINIDLVDAAILSYMIQFSAAGEISTIKAGKKMYYWIAYNKILSDLPLLKIKKDTLYRKIKGLESVGLIEPHPSNRELNKTYFHITNLAKGILFHMPKPTDKNPEVARTYGKKSVGGTDKNPEVPTDKNPYNYNTISNPNINDSSSEQPPLQNVELAKLNAIKAEILKNPNSLHLSEARELLKNKGRNFDEELHNYAMHILPTERFPLDGASLPRRFRAACMKSEKVEAKAQPVKITRKASDLMS